MYYSLLAAALVLHAYFWGIGLAWLAGPRRWRRFWWALAPGWGLALQSAVVWLGVHTDLPGTAAYAGWSELLPLALFLLAGKIRGWGALKNLRGLVGLALLMVAVGWLYLSPLAAATRGLTATSLGSCDAADYAAGARVFQEFSRADRTGFLGQTEVSGVGSAQTFFEFFVRLNHFTPSALLAHNGTIFDCRPHELVGLTGAVLVLLTLPAVLLLARVAVGLRGTPALVVVAIFAVSAVNAYAVHQGALGQLYGALGIALLTLAALGAGRVRGPRESVWAFAPLALAAFWLLAGSYNFILVVTLAPAGCWLVLESIRRREIRPVLPVTGMLATMLLVCAVVFWGRFDGLIERFRLFGQFDFGWPVPLLTPEKWLGLVKNPALQSWPLAGRGVLAAAVIVAWLAGVALFWRRQRVRALAALALVLPVVAGWLVVAGEIPTRANASYDAYKIISVFYPELLAGLLAWVAAVRGGRLWREKLAGAALAVLLGANLFVAGEFRRQMMAPPLRLEKDTIALGRLETDARFASFNIRVEEFWARLWANHFLLRKPQYFPTHSYEGRLNTPLRGEWDLSDSLLYSVPADPADFVRLGDRFHLTRRGATGGVEVSFHTGWYPLESHGSDRWRWGAGDALLLLDNPATGPRRVALTLRLQGVSAREVEVRLDELLVKTIRLGAGQEDFALGGLDLPAGKSVLRLHALAPPQSPSGDDRKLSLALHGLTLTVLPDAEVPPQPR